jgi:protein-S-isoprenylcysteine O-methyltransferase Ste14
MIAYFVLVAGWIGYFALHSVLASPLVKSRYNFKGYRIAYTLVAVFGLLAMLFYGGSIAAAPFFVSQGIPRYASMVLTILGVMIIQRSFRHYSFRGFVGLAVETAELRTDGILKHVRHPIYSGLILIIAGFFLFIPNLPTAISCGCMLLYLPIGMALEEKKLVAMFGDAYIAYKKRVPALLPKLF